MQGPFEINLKIRMKAGDNTAIVTYNLPAGSYPTREKIEEAVAASLVEVQKQLDNEDVRLLTRGEFQNELLAERTGQYIEYASPGDWEV